jgi:hypothetical protein
VVAEVHGLVGLIRIDAPADDDAAWAKDCAERRQGSRGALRGAQQPKVVAEHEHTVERRSPCGG